MSAFDPKRTSVGTSAVAVLAATMLFRKPREGMRRRDFITFVGGVTAAWPLAARAQTIPIIGFLAQGTPDEGAALLSAVRKGLGEANLIEGRDFTSEFRWAQNDAVRLPWPCGRVGATPCRDHCRARYADGGTRSQAGNKQNSDCLFVWRRPGESRTRRKSHP